MSPTAFAKGSGHPTRAALTLILLLVFFAIPGVVAAATPGGPPPISPTASLSSSGSSPKPPAASSSAPQHPAQPAGTSSAAPTASTATSATPETPTPGGGPPAPAPNPLSAFGCDKADIVCLDPNGGLVLMPDGPDIVPDVVPGQHLTIAVIGDKSALVGQDLTISVDALKSRATTHVADGEAPGETVIISLSFTPPTPASNPTQNYTQFAAHFTRSLTTGGTTATKAATDVLFSLTPLQSLLSSFGCDKSSIICLDQNGSPLVVDGAPDEVPDVVPGQHLTIGVIADARELAGQDLAITVDGLSSDKPVHVAAAQPRGQVVIISRSFTPPAAPQYSTQFSAHFTRSVAAGTATTTLAENDLTFSVGAAGYHFSAGVLLPVVFRGTRIIQAVRVPNTSQSTLVFTESTQSLPVYMEFEYFPWGIQGGPALASSFTSPNPYSCGSKARWWENAVVCPAAWVYQRIIQTVGVEAATTIGTNPFQEYFVGGSIEPVRGASINFGAAFVQGQFFPPTYTPGALAPSTGPGFVPYTQYMIRPYVGLTISPEILAFVIEALKTAQGLAPVSPP